MKYTFFNITLLVALCMSIPMQGGPFHHDEISDRWSYGYDYSPRPELGPLTIGEITKDDRDAVEGLKNIEGGLVWYKNYYRNRTLMAKAARLYNATGAQSDSDKVLLNKIFSAAMGNYQDFHLVKELLEHGVNPNELVGDFHERPLFMAKTVAMAQLLVSHNATFNGEHHIYDDSIVHHACRDDSADLLGYFLKHSGIEVNSRRSRDGFTPLHVLIESVFTRCNKISEVTKKLSLLLAAGAKVMVRNNKNQTALDLVYAGIADQVYGKDVVQVLVSPLKIAEQAEREAIAEIARLTEGSRAAEAAWLAKFTRIAEAEQRRANGCTVS
jgi:hypothetical protein